MKSRRSALPETVVVDFSRGTVKMALAESAGDAVRFHGITSLATRLTDDEGVLRLDSVGVIERLRRDVERRGWKGMRAACLLPGSATSTQSFLMPQMPAADLRRAVGLKLSDTLHFELEEAEFDFNVVPDERLERSGQVLTLVAAAKSETVRQSLAALKAAGLKPVAVGAAAESLANLSRSVSLWNTEEATIHVDIGIDSSILNLFEGGLLRFSREIDIAGSAFTSALMRPILTDQGAVELDAHQAEEVLAVCSCPRESEDIELPHGVRASQVAPLLEPVAQRLSAEIERSVDYLCALLERSDVDRIVLSGLAGRLRNLDRLLIDNLSIPVVHSDPVERALNHWRLAVCGECPEDLAGFGAILGYSLGQRRPINLLPRDERIEQVVERVSRARRAVVLPAIAASVCLAGVGVPIKGDYERAEALLQESADQLAVRIAESDQRRLDSTRTRQSVERVRAARGLVPNWVGVMQELSVVLPDQVEIVRLEVSEDSGAPSVRLSALVHAGDEAFDVLSSRLTEGLATSPFFRDVHVIEASLRPGDDASRFEATFEIIAGDGTEPEPGT